MKKIILINLLLCFCITTLAQVPSWLWAKSIGSSSYDHVAASMLDTSRNMYIVGGFTGTVDFDPGAGVFNLTSATGAPDIFILKLDSSGNFVWVKSVGGSDNRAYAACRDGAGNIYLTGYFEGTADMDPGPSIYNLATPGLADIFVLKMDNSGNFLWAKQMGGFDEEHGISIAVDEAANVYTTGDFKATADFDPGAGTFNLTSAGAEEMFISKLDSLGNFVWAKAIGGIGGDQGSKVLIDDWGNLYTTGGFMGTVDFNPGAGVFNLTSASVIGYADLFIAKYDTAANFIWAKQIGSTHNEVGFDMCYDTSGSIYTVGHFQDTVDFDPSPAVYNLIANGATDVFILKLDSAGNFTWAVSMGGSASSYDESRAIRLDVAGNVYTVGIYYGTVDFDPGPGVYNLTTSGSAIFISKLNSNGNFAWARSIQSFGYEYSRSFNLDSDYNFYIAGYFHGSTITFLPTTLHNADNSGNTGDIFIAKQSACQTSSSVFQSACNSYTSPSGNIWTSSGIYSDTVNNVWGCDSVITIHLNLNTVNTSVAQSGIILTANASGVLYQWLDCNNGYSIITGDTGQNFIPSVNGSYAVEITQNGCTDTSSCYIISGVGISEIAFYSILRLFPNPAMDEIGIESKYKIKSVEVYNLFGEKILRYVLHEETKKTIDISTFCPGIYFVRIQGIHGNDKIEKFIKQ
jgi:hypothetical protein